jgi:hypothetical protein
MKQLNNCDHIDPVIQRSFRPEHIRLIRNWRHSTAKRFAGLAIGDRPLLRDACYRSSVFYATLALLCFGCARTANPLLSSGPHPRVEDCAIVQQATPTRYVCNGKIYTSVQLDEIRKGEPVQLSEQASHGALPGNVISPTGNFGTYPNAGASNPASGPR